MNAVSTISDVIVAVAAVVSAWILLKTFRSVNDQTEISRSQAELSHRQFEIMLRRQEELSWPELTVTTGNYTPSLNSAGQNGGTNGRLTMTLRNFGTVALRNVKVTVFAANTETVLRYYQGTFSIPPGSAEDVRGPFFIPPEATFVPADTKCDFETLDGRRFQKCDSWYLYYSKDHLHDHLDSSHVEELPKS
jgi:hypothetical protein